MIHVVCGPVYSVVVLSGTVVMAPPKGYKHSPETRAKMKHSPEARAKMSAARRGKPRIGTVSEAGRERIRQSKLGKKASPETREKLSKAHSGKPHPCKRPLGLRPSDATKEKLRQANLGKKASDETRAKLSAVHAGIPLSQEHRQKLSEVLRNLTGPAKNRMAEAASRNNAARLANGLGFGVRGYHTSPKAGPAPVAYRSKMIELALMQMLDGDPDVKNWDSPFTIRYVNPEGQARHTLPDFMVTRVDGTRYIIEGKGSHLVAAYKAGEKFQAVHQWCQTHGVGFQLVSAKKAGHLMWESIT